MDSQRKLNSFTGGHHITNHKEILRLKSLGLSNNEIAAACGCGRNTVTRTLQRAQMTSVGWEQLRTMPSGKVTDLLFPENRNRPTYRMPDYEQIHKEMQKSGVTLSLLWVEYCEQCRAEGELPYQSTQFNKYYADYVHKTKTTIYNPNSAPILIIEGVFTIQMMDAGMYKGLDLITDRITIAGLQQGMEDTCSNDRKIVESRFFR